MVYGRPGEWVCYHLEECLEFDIWTDKMCHVLGPSGYPKSALNQSGSPLLIAHTFVLSMAVGGFLVIIFQPKPSYICPIILFESDGSKNHEN